MSLSEMHRVTADGDLPWASDVAVTQAAWRYEPGAREVLAERHGSAARLAAGFVPDSEAGAAFTAVFERMSSATAQFVPFRIAWLSQIAGTSLPLNEQDDEIWAAFLSLSPSWQAAVWHRCVEGDSVESLSRILGLDEESAARATVTARASMTRRVAHAYVPGAKPACQEIHEHLISDVSPSLGVRFTRALREHARHCDHCLPMLRDVLRLEHTLREALAARVLGQYAGAYLSARPFIAPARLVSRPRADFELSRRAVRPLIGLVTVGAAATAIASVVSVGVSDPGSVQPDTELAAVQAVAAPYQLDRLPVGTTKIVLTSPRIVEGALAAGSGAPDSAADGSKGGKGPTAVAVDPTPVATPTGGSAAPTPPSGGQNPGPGGSGGSGGSGGPGSSGSGSPVSVGVSDAGSVTVVVDPPGTSLPSVEVESPDVLDAPVAAVGSVVGGGLSANLNGGPSAGQDLGARAMGLAG